MKFLIFILVYPIVWLISLLPMRLLYLFSDFIYLLVYYIFGYRKKVVTSNLHLAFPEKSDKEIIKIQKKFYSHFIDIFIEMIKSFSISEKELQKRYQFSNIELLQEQEKKGKSIVLMGSHYANWEWIIVLNKYISFKTYAAYTRIQNKYFEKKILASRERLGANFKKTNEFIPFIESNKKNNVLALYGLLSDQSPQLDRSKYFSEFMGVKVPVHTGAEFLAKKFDHSVILLKTKKIKRGYYITEFKILAKNPNDYNNYEITDLFLREVESQIKEKPEHYFWSHKRWKHANRIEEELERRKKLQQKS